MKTRHAKSPCCREAIYHFGNRRRQCRVCGRTWRVRKKRRGRKLKHSSVNLPQQVLADYGRIASWARRKRMSVAATSFRLRGAMGHILKTTCRGKLPKGSYALLGDGLYFKFRRMDWVMYVMAVKPVKSHRAYFLDPVLLEGKEGYGRWQIAIASISPEVKKRVRAFVSDGFRGSKLLAREYGWIHQRCHFHLLMALIRRRGRRSYRLKSSGIRERMLATVRLLLAATDPKILNRQKLKVQRLLSQPLCPPWVRIQTVEFLRVLNDFRAYLIYPELNLPTTTNSIESAGKLIRKATSTARTPQSVLLRATAFLRLKKSITCNGRFSTKIT